MTREAAAFGRNVRGSDIRRAASLDIADDNLPHRTIA